MNDWIVPLSVMRRSDVVQVGGKAAALGELLAAGFPVPPGLCVTTAVFHQAIGPYREEIARLCQQMDVLEPRTAVAASENIFVLLQNITLPEAVTAELHSYVEGGDWGPETNPGSSLFAIRSSATAEDQEEVSYAGQYATTLGVRGQQAIEEAVLVCWLSFFTPHALMARAYQGALGLDEGMAVLIQPLIAAECAGVCFTVDPIQERDDVMVVNAAWGLGEGVVDGSVPADSHWVQRRNFSIEWQRIVEKGEERGARSEGRRAKREERRARCEGRGERDTSEVVRLPVSDERRRAACLPEAWVRRVAEFGLAVEQVCGRPQEIEWAIADGQFWLLQSRPITGLPEEMAIAPHFPVAWQDEAERLYAWRLTEYCEEPEPPLPLEHDFMGLRESIREETCRYLGADRHEAWRFWNGRAYWRRIPLGITPADRQIRRQAFEDLHDRLQAVGWTSWDYWGPEMEQMVERLQAFNREMADGATLAKHLAQAQAVVRYCMAIHPRILFRPREAFFAAFSAVSGLEGQGAETAAYQLLDNEESKLTRLVDRLYELAQVAQGEIAITELIWAMPDDVMAQLSALPETGEFRAKLADLLAEYGERMGHGYGSEMTVLTPTWYEEPERVLYLVRAYLAVDEAPAAVRSRLRQAREERVTALCEACGEEETAAEFQRQLAYARRSMVGLEDHNHLIEQVAEGQLRLVIMAAARWLVKQGVLAAADDVFWLRFGEIEEVLRGGERGAKSEGRRVRGEERGGKGEEGRAREEDARFWGGVVSGRQAEWEQWAELVPPPILGIPEAVLPPRPPFVDEVNVGEDGEESGRLVGLGASPGQVEGPALVMLKGYLLPEMEPGTILVAQNAGPLWTPYFPQLGGLVLEEGSLGQHAAATAREYGIPAVVGCRQALRLIADDDWVRLNGTTGVVEVER